MDDKQTSSSEHDTLYGPDTVGDIILDFNATSYSMANTEATTTLNTGITFGTGTTGPGSPFTDYSNYTITSIGSIFGNDENSISGIETIKTKSGKKINIDELAEFMESMKRRLLILTPKFELHEKYPMLKQMYEEYLAMERLLDGPDCGLDPEDE